MLEMQNSTGHTPGKDLGASRGLQKLKGTEDLKGARKAPLLQQRQEGGNGVGTLEMEEQDAMLTEG